MTDRSNRDDMKHDALLEQTAQAADFAAHHAKAIIAGVVVVAVLGLGFVFFQSSRAKAEDRAAEVLFHAQYEYDSGNYAAAATHLAELERNLGGTTSGRLALPLAGNVHAAMGEWSEALADYEAALDKAGKDPLIRMTAARGRAAALEALDRHQEAAQAYLDLARDTRLEPAKAGLLYQAAENLAAAGSVDEAKSLYEEVSRNEMDRRTAQLAALRLAELNLASS